jgi:hypothetical protein
MNYKCTSTVIMEMIIYTNIAGVQPVYNFKYTNQQFLTEYMFKVNVSSDAIISSEYMIMSRYDNRDGPVTRFGNLSLINNNYQSFIDEMIRTVKMKLNTASVQLME